MDDPIADIDENKESQSPSLPPTSLEDELYEMRIENGYTLIGGDEDEGGYRF